MPEEGTAISENERWDYQHDNQIQEEDADGLAAMGQGRPQFEINDVNTANWFALAFRMHVGFYLSS